MFFSSDVSAYGTNDPENSVEIHADVSASGVTVEWLAIDVVLATGVSFGGIRAAGDEESPGGPMPSGAPTAAATGTITFTYDSFSEGFGEFLWTAIIGSEVSGDLTLAGNVRYRLAGQTETQEHAFAGLTLSGPGGSPVIEASPVSVELDLGATAEFEVQASGSEPLEYQWFKDGTEIPGEESAILRIDTVALTDVGEYWVQVTNDAGQEASQTADLVVRMAPQISLTPQTLEIRAGLEVSIRGFISGVVSEVQWFRDGVLVPDQTDPLLRFTTARMEDSGVYTLQASNQFGTTQSPSQISLTVLPPFDFVTDLPRLVVSAGDPIELSADVEGGEPLQYHWLRDGARLEEHSSETLRIEAASFSDGGVYQLRGVSPFGDVETNRARIVVVPPELPGRLQIDPDWQVEVTRPGASLHALHVPDRESILVAGEFNSIDQHPTKSVARFNRFSAVDRSFTADIEFEGSFSHLLEQADGKILVGGNFNARSSLGLDHNLLRLRANGMADDSFRFAAAPWQFVQDIAISSTDLVYVATRSRLDDADRILRRLLDDGRFDQGFALSAGVLGLPELIAAGPEGTLYVATQSTTDGVARLYLVNESGAIVRALDVSDFSVIKSINVDESGRVFVHGMMASGFAVGWRRFESTGEMDSGFSGQGAYPITYGASLSGDGGLIISSSLLFEHVGDDGALSDSRHALGLGMRAQTEWDGVDRIYYIKSDWLRSDERLELGLFVLDSSLPAGWVKDFTRPGRIAAISGNDDGRIVVGGDFQTFDGFVRPNLVYLNSATLELDPLVQFRIEAPTYGMVRQPGIGHVLWGSFTELRGSPFNGLGRMLSSGSLNFGFSSNGDVVGLAEVERSSGLTALSDGSFLLNSTLQTGGENQAVTSLYRFKSDGAWDIEFRDQIRSWAPRLEATGMLELLSGDILLAPLQNPLVGGGGIIQIGPDGALAGEHPVVPFEEGSTVSLAFDVGERIWQFGQNGLQRFDPRTPEGVAFSSPAETITYAPTDPLIAATTPLGDGGMLAFGTQSFSDEDGVRRDFATRFDSEGKLVEDFEVVGLWRGIQAAWLADDGRFLIASGDKLYRTRPWQLPEVALTRSVANPKSGEPLLLRVDLPDPAVSYRWFRNGEVIPGATRASYAIPETRAADAGLYSVNAIIGDVVVASDPLPVILNDRLDGLDFRHEPERYVLPVRDSVGVRVNNSWSASAFPQEITWSVLIPEGWTVVPVDNADGEFVPTEPGVDLAEWNWPVNPTREGAFSYDLIPPEDGVGLVEVEALASYRGSGIAAEPVLVAPDPFKLRIVNASIHTADTDGSLSISLSELLRVIEIYNTRQDSSRTGQYRLRDDSVDGFEPDAVSPSTGTVIFARYHAADTDRNGNVSLSELLRVIELYNVRSGTQRTGSYTTDESSVDGFRPAEI